MFPRFCPSTVPVVPLAATFPVRSNSKTMMDPATSRRSFSSLDARCPSFDSASVRLSPCGHCRGDGVIEASIQCVEVCNADRRIKLHCKLGYCLANIPIFVHHLIYGEA